MEADRILQALEAHLQPIITTAGGSLQVADNPWEVVDMLKVSPSSWRVVLSFEDEASMEPLNRGGWISGLFTVYVQMPKGLGVNRGESIYKTNAAGRSALLALCGQVKQWMRAIQLNDNDDVAKDDPSHFAFLSGSWVDGVEGGNKNFRTRRMDFQLVYAQDDPWNNDDPDGDNVTVPQPFRITGVSDDGAFYLISLAGQPAGRVPRYESVPGDPGGTGSGWRITAVAEDPGFYVVSLSGVANGRIPRYEA